MFVFAILASMNNSAIYILLDTHISWTLYNGALRRVGPGTGLTLYNVVSPGQSSNMLV